MIQMVLQESKNIPVIFACRYFGLSSSGYYDWKNRSNKIHFVKKSEICSAIKKVFKDSKSTYGSPRVYEILKSNGINASENTIAKYMNEMGLDARHKKKHRIQTTDSSHSYPIAPRLFEAETPDSLPSSPGNLLAGDITYLRIGDKFIYLAVVLDLYNREIIGWSIGKTLETKLVLKALEGAIKKVGPDAEVIFHSDRGSQYASEAYRKFLKSNSIKPSMSRRGNCYDNCYVESWFGSLKKEWLYRTNYSTEEQLKSLVFEYIEVWYNRRRKHTSLGYKSPVEYRLNRIAH